MPFVIYVVVGILAFSVIGNSIIAGQGGAKRPKSDGQALIDVLINGALLVWLLVVFL